MTALVTRLWQGFERAMQARRMRHELAALDDRMLQDIGISRAQAIFEAERWVARPHDDRGRPVAVERERADEGHGCPVAS